MKCADMGLLVVGSALKLFTRDINNEYKAINWTKFNWY